MNGHRRTISLTPDPWRIGSWEPARLGLSDSIGITILLTFVGLVRGVDYITPKTTASPALSLVEQAFPLWVWGLMFAVPSVFLAVSAIARVHAGVWIGHWLLVIAYVGLATGLSVEYLGRPWFDGIRTVASLAAPFALHAMIAFRTGWRPPRDT